MEPPPIRVFPAEIQVISTCGMLNDILTKIFLHMQHDTKTKGKKTFIASLIRRGRIAVRRLKEATGELIEDELKRITKYLNEVEKYIVKQIPL
ncbi:MAG: hypothetical protein PVG65_03345 [Candidatus Thorarchaeota archaeon]|jgi:hypothetical protein